MEFNNYEKESNVGSKASNDDNSSNLPKILIVHDEEINPNFFIQNLLILLRKNVTDHVHNSSVNESQANAGQDGVLSGKYNSTWEYDKRNGVFYDSVSSDSDPKKIMKKITEHEEYDPPDVVKLTNTDNCDENSNQDIYQYKYDGKSFVRDCRILNKKLIEMSFSNEKNITIPQNQLIDDIDNSICIWVLNHYINTFIRTKYYCAEVELWTCCLRRFNLPESQMYSEKKLSGESCKKTNCHENECSNPYNVFLLNKNYSQVSHDEKLQNDDNSSSLQFNPILPEAIIFICDEKLHQSDSYMKNFLLISSNPFCTKKVKDDPKLDVKCKNRCATIHDYEINSDITIKLFLFSSSEYSIQKSSFKTSSMRKSLPQISEWVKENMIESFNVHPQHFSQITIDSNAINQKNKINSLLYSPYKNTSEEDKLLGIFRVSESLECNAWNSIVLHEKNRKSEFSVKESIEGLLEKNKSNHHSDSNKKFLDEKFGQSLKCNMASNSLSDKIVYLNRDNKKEKFDIRDMKVNNYLETSNDYTGIVANNSNNSGSVEFHKFGEILSKIKSAREYSMNEQNIKKRHDAAFQAMNEIMSAMKFD